jgi:hypothetical protein
MECIAAFFRRRREGREARRLVAEVFRRPDLLRGTSLAARHAGRWVLHRYEAEGGRPIRIWFGILRHPRPYAYSPQSHKVIETYLYDVPAGKVERVEGFNVTRSKGRDAD